MASPASLTITVQASDIPEVKAALERAGGLEVAARAVVDLEWRAWRREGEDVGTVSLTDLDALLDRITALRVALEAVP